MVACSRINSTSPSLAAYRCFARSLQTMQWLVVLRFVMGIGIGAEYVMGFGLVTEFVPPTHRGRYMGLLALFGGVGVFVTSVSAW